MSGTQERLGIRVVDVGQRSWTTDLWPFSKRMSGGLVAAGLHLAVYIVLTWAPVGELRTLANDRPGETWITLAPFDTGIVTDRELDKPAVITDTLRNLDQPANPSADPTSQAKVPQNPSEGADAATSDNVGLSGAMAPALGTSSTSSLGKGGSDDPFAGAAPTTGMAMPITHDPPQPDTDTELQTLPMTKDALAELKDFVTGELPSNPEGPDKVLSVELLVQVDSRGIVLDVHAIDTTLSPNVLASMMHYLRGRQLFVTNNSDQPSWQTLRLEL